MGWRCAHRRQRIQSGIVYNTSCRESFEAAGIVSDRVETISSFSIYPLVVILYIFPPGSDDHICCCQSVPPLPTTASKTRKGTPQFCQLDYGTAA